MDSGTPAAIALLCERLAALKLLPRTGWLQRGVASAESVAEHSFGVAFLALLLSDAAPGIDRGRLLAIALLHDAAEALLGDLPATARRHFGAAAKHAAEHAALAEMLAILSGRDTYLALWQEYAAGTSAEARLVKGIDRLEMLAQALAYERAGSRALGEFWHNVDEGWDPEFPVLHAIALYLHSQRPPS